MYAKMGDGFRFAHDSEFSFVLLAVLFFCAEYAICVDCFE